MLDSLSPLTRHFVLLVAPVVLGFISTDLVPVLQGVNPLAATLLGAVVTQLLLLFSKLTTQYGTGSDDGTSL